MFFIFDERILLTVADARAEGSHRLAWSNGGVRDGDAEDLEAQEDPRERRGRCEHEERDVADRLASPRARSTRGESAACAVLAKRAAEHARARDTRSTRMLVSHVR